MLRRTVVTAALLGLLAPTVAAASAADAATHRTPVLRISTNHTSYTAGARAVVYIHLGISGAGHKVGVYSTIPGKSTKKLDTVTLNSHGNAQGTVKLTYNESFTVKFSGNSSYAPAKATTRVVQVRVATTNAIKGSYRKSGSVYLIHDGKSGKFYGYVAPNKTGSKLRFVLQTYSSGKWHTALTRTEKMVKVESTVSGAAVSFVYTKNVRLRIRAEYAGNRTNAGNVTGWRYAEFV